MEKNTNNRGGSFIIGVVEIVLTVFSIIALLNRPVLYDWANQYTGIVGLGADAAVFTILLIGVINVLVFIAFVVMFVVSVKKVIIR